MNEIDKQKLLNVILKQLSGTKQRVALYRFNNEVDTSKAHVFGMKIPQIEGTELKLKEKILTELRRDVNRPLVLHLRSNAPPSIRDIVSNQARWNKVLDDGEQFPCTCAMLERVGLTRSSNGHVCCKWSEFPEDFCPVNTRRMSVLSRVMPSPARVHSELKRFVIRAISRIGSIDVRKWLHHVEEWIDYYRELHLGYCKAGFPMETRLKQFQKCFGSQAVFTRAIDKEKPNLGCTCPQSYRQRAITLYRDNPSYEAISPEDAKRYGDEICELLKNLDIKGVRVRAAHVFGLCNQWTKKSNPAEKMRPLISYSGHGGVDVLSLACRAGLFLLKRAFPDHIGVSSLSEVVDSLINFQRDIDLASVDESLPPLHLNQFKFDNTDFSMIFHIA